MDDTLPATPLMRRIRASVIGDDALLDGPYGRRRVTYLDHTASGRAIGFIEDFLREHVLPGYANTHTESSAIGLRTTRLREEAREIIGEHHSNELPWRESIADVVVIREDADGHIDQGDLKEQLVRHAARPC